MCTIIGVLLFFQFSKSLNTVNKGVNTSIKNDLTEENSVEKERKIKVLSMGETIGYFESIDWGDYCHFNIKDLNGKEQSFFVYINFNRKIDIESYKKDASYKGRKLKVKWQEIETYIPEGGGNYKIIELLDLEEIK